MNLKALILIFAGIILITNLACTISIGSEPVQIIQPTRTLSEQVYIIMTVQAAPVRQISDATTQASNSSASANYDPSLVTEGQSQFASICSSCHGADAQGITNLGKNLTNSEFARNLSDQDLINFIKTGRPIWDPMNTTGVDMPPKGGNPALTDEQLLAIVTYLRSLDPLYMPPASVQVELPTQIVSVTTAIPSNQEMALVPPTSSPQPIVVQAVSTPVAVNTNDLAAQGENLFTASCSACHGIDAHGLPNLGKNLLASEFVQGLSDQDLLAFIKTGRPIWDPLNTTGVDMPAKGGNPALTDEQLLSIITFLRANAE